MLRRTGVQTTPAGMTALTAFPSASSREQSGSHSRSPPRLQQLQRAEARCSAWTTALRSRDSSRGSRTSPSGNRSWLHQPPRMSWQLPSKSLTLYQVYIARLVSVAEVDVSLDPWSMHCGIVAGLQSMKCGGYQSSPALRGREGRGKRGEGVRNMHLVKECGRCHTL